MANSVAEINHQVTQSSIITNNAVMDVEQATLDINKLSESSSKIGNILAIIVDIASQTNLLALNATIEAARAGEAGKGFAVVASEVKALASQTAKATDEITLQISEIQNSSNQAVQSIKTIANTINNVSSIATAIAAAVEEQSAATNEVARNIDQASTGTMEVSASIGSISQVISEYSVATSQILETSTELSQRSDAMRNSVSDFLVEVRKAI